MVTALRPLQERMQELIDNATLDKAYEDHLVNLVQDIKKYDKLRATVMSAIDRAAPLLQPPQISSYRNKERKKTRQWR